MAFQKLALARIGLSMRDDNASTTFSVYSTSDAAATVSAAGYFNDVRSAIKPGDCIWASVGIGTTPKMLLLRVATVPDTGNVTVAAAIAEA